MSAGSQVMNRGAGAAEVLWDSRDRGVGPCGQDVLKGRKEGEAKHNVCQVLTPTGAQAKH